VVSPRPEYDVKLLVPFINSIQPMDNNYNADLLDAMADMAYEQEQAMRESDQSEWTLVERQWYSSLDST
jgi:hypothetical protein